MISQHNRELNRTSGREPIWHSFLRGAAALSLAGAMTLASLLGGTGEVDAQDASAGVAAAAIVPETAAIYFGFTLDTESSQWVLANELLQRAGAEQDVTSLIGDATSSMTGDASPVSGDPTAILGGEAAIVVTDLESIAGDVSGAATGFESTEGSALTSILGDIELPMGDGSTTPGAGAALVIQPSDLVAATKLIDDEVSAAASGLDVQVKLTTHGSVTVSSVPGDVETGETGLAYAVVGDFLVVSETAEDIFPFIETAAGDTPALAGVASFDRADTALAGDRLGFGYINGASLANGLNAVDTTGLGFGTAAGGIFGVGGVTGLSVIADPAGFRLNTVDIPGEGAAVEPTGSAADLSLAGKVPANTLLFMNGFGLGQGALLQSLGLVLVTAFNSAANPGDATPVAVPSIDELYQQTAMLVGFNLKTDFIDQLVGEYGFALWNVDVDDPSQISAVLTSNVEQPATLTDAVSKISLLVQAAGQGKVNVTTRVVNDSAVSSVDIQSEGQTVATLEYGVIDGHFIVGVGGGIDEFMTGSANTLADSADYRAALAALPAEHDGVFYVNAAEAVALETSSMGSAELGAFADASTECGAYSTQAAAQEAYDADNVENFALDMNFDGRACEDFFATATPVAETLGVGDYTAVRAFASVSFKQDGLAYTNSILLIAE